MEIPIHQPGHDDFMKLFLESQRGLFYALGDVFGSQCNDAREISPKHLDSRFGRRLRIMIRRAILAVGVMVEFGLR